MTFYRPSYYKNFKCIGSDCAFTCCREWAIGVDSKTLKKWQRLRLPDCTLSPADYVTDGQIQLNADGLCPFLDESHLCNMVKAHGEESLSNTCHTFPREWHVFDERTEETLSIACPEVFDTVWNLERFEIEKSDRPIPFSHPAEEPEPCQELFFKIRDWFLEILQGDNISKNSHPVSTELALKIIFFFALDLYEAYVDDKLTDSFFEHYKKHNLYDQLVTEISRNESAPMDSMFEQNELLLDLSENYRNQGMYRQWLEPLCKAAKEMESATSIENIEKALEEFQQIWKSNERHHRNILCEEIYSTCLIPGGDLYSMVLKLQWIAITHAVYKQAMFLDWLKSRDKASASGETSANSMLIATIIFRMTGYSEADIEEYLENSFEDIIWEWPYFALVVG